MARENWLVVAVESRIQQALEAAGTTHEGLAKEIGAAVTSNIRTYAGANGVTEAGGTEFVQVMRRLGGYTAMIETVIGPEPAAECNGIGVPESPAYWLWVAKTRLVGVIRERVQMAIATEGL